MLVPSLDSGEPAEKRAPSGPITLAALESVRLSREIADLMASDACHQVCIAVGKLRVAIRCSRESHARALALRFGDLLASGPPDVSAHAVEADGKLYFWLTLERVFVYDGRTNDEIFTFFADNVTMNEVLRERGYFGLHAAVVTNGLRAAAILGTTTAGKTTTAVACVRRGLRLSSDERCIFEDGLLVPFLRALTVRRGGREALLNDPQEGSPIDALLRRFPDGAEVGTRPSTLFGDAGVATERRRLDLAFLIEGRAGLARAEPCDLYAVLPQLLAASVCAETDVERLARALHELRGVRCYRLTLGSPDATARLIEERLDAAS